ncbi:2-phospho-L-lactate transferase [Variovorax sp. PBL-E5]|uniref:2-phospho-L-lactate transferase n=1 Tax=Variovorax sp. PBL-E5 TaxID=434014 RepID=UPI0013194E4C|nr:2-phospho-L-lactate transferase [Variovorax sp. PBL-E5]VTU45355.1 LPPG:FO 2-phospho-L-lactate transferase [Variovorax sp. PBL-E5]
MTSRPECLKVVVLAGGVGGARMARGFARIPSVKLSVVVNVGDDDWFHGLKVCPDLDTVLYTLSGVVNRSQGWGVADDATRALDTLRKLESPDTWMTLGDADLGLHIYRTQALRSGQMLTQTMSHVARRFGLGASLLPVSDQECPTLVDTEEGLLRFQEWFVKSRGMPRVRGLSFQGAAQASVTLEVSQAFSNADLIVIAPSNPLLSIDPMLAIQGFRTLVSESKAPRVAISPLIRGRAVKGPLVKLLEDLEAPATSEAIASHYAGLVDAFVVDQEEPAEVVAGVAHHMRALQMPTLMSDEARSQELAGKLLAWHQSI